MVVVVGTVAIGSLKWGATCLRPPPPRQLQPPQPRRAAFLQQHASRDVQWWCLRLSLPQDSHGGRRRDWEGGKYGGRKPVLFPWQDYSLLHVSISAKTPESHLVTPAITSRTLAVQGSVTLNALTPAMRPCAAPPPYAQPFLPAGHQWRPWGEEWAR